MIKKLYYFLYLVLFKNTPEDYRPYALFFPWVRSKLVSAYLKKSGKKLRVKKGADISPNASVGDFSELGTRCMIQANVHMGDHVIMGPDVKIYSRNHKFDRLDLPIAEQGKNYFETHIGSDVWLGANVVVTAGSKIGNHAVIAAGAVVSGEIPDYAVAGGIPAKVIKYRNE